VAPGTPVFDEEERREFGKRFRELRQRNAEILGRDSLSTLQSRSGAQ